MPRSLNFQLASFYLTAKELVISSGFQAEIDWQDDLRFGQIEEPDFLREAAWVVLSTGFRESVVRRTFPAISEAFLQWRNARAISDQARSCRRRALLAFSNERKIDSIITIAEKVSTMGFPLLRKQIENGGVGFLQSLPYIGPVTAFHLAKNIGLNVAKPDRHLVRAAKSVGISCPQKMCEMIHQVVGDPVSVIDLVIWRYATIQPQYPNEFRSISGN